MLVYQRVSYHTSLRNFHCTGDRASVTSMTCHEIASIQRPKIAIALFESHCLHWLPSLELDAHTVTEMYLALAAGTVQPCTW